MDQSFGELLRIAESGDAVASDALFASLYAELHGIAERQLHRGGGELTLGTTTLHHEAYLRISDREGLAFSTRGQFLAYAARAMRRLMLDYARRGRTRKRGGQFEITSISTDVLGSLPDATELSRLGEALDERLARVVDLKFFCGFSFGEIAAMTGVSERTVQRDWEKARIYLHRVLSSDIVQP